MGVLSAGMNSGAAFDQNVPTEIQLSWQDQRAAEKRLPPASVVCAPVWCTYGKRYQPVGIIYIASSDGSVFAETSDARRIEDLLKAAGERIIKATPAGGPLP
jgi:hypothetical protein